MNISLYLICILAKLKKPSILLYLMPPGITTRREIITLVHFGQRVDVTV